MDRVLKAVSLGIATGLFGILTALTPIGAALEENTGLLSLFRLRGPVEAPPEVTIVRLDRSSGERLGVPREVLDDLHLWPRSDRARLVDVLVERGASVIVLDMWLDTETETDEDAALAEAVARAGRVVLVERLASRRLEVGAGEAVQRVNSVQVMPPIPLLATAARESAPFPLPAHSRQVNQFWSFVALPDPRPTLPAIALQLHALPVYDRWRALLEATGAPGIDRLPSDADALAEPGEVRRLIQVLRSMFHDNPGLGDRVGSRLRMLETAGADEAALMRALLHLYSGPSAFLLNFYGPAGTVTGVAFADLIDGTQGRRGAIPDLSGKAVFVGWADPSPDANQDRIPTVFSQPNGVDLSGVEVLATAFANLVHGETLRPVDRWTTAAVLLVFGLVIGVSAYLLPPLMACLFAAVAGAAYLAVALHLFGSASLWFPVAVPLMLQLPVGLFGGLIWQQQNMLRGVRNYLPRKAADQLRTNLVDRSSTRELRYGTCLATDAEGYTTLAEGMGPDALAALMNEYFEALFDPIVRRDGIVTGISGDGVMSVWTAPQPDRMIRGQAALAALDIVGVVGRFNARHAPYHLKTRIGLHAGWVVLGNVGGAGHFAYDVVGDTPNTASRIEGLNKILGTRILASEQVIADVSLLLTRRMGRFYLVGKSDALTIHEVLCPKANAAPRELRLCELFADALKAFEAQRWFEAAERFDAIAGLYPGDGPTRFYRGLCSQYCITPPPANDAVVIRCKTK